MRSSYREEDVILLLKDITGLVEPQPTKERERLIQSGKHYCEMLPIEYVPSKTYMQVYREALKNYAKPTAQAIGRLAGLILKKRGSQVVLVSLARAGIPIGILLKRYIYLKYGIEVKHYAISIIRGRGIDKNAMKFLLERYEPARLVFVDGWIGKGAILNELKKELEAFPGIPSEIAVVADPANVTEFCGTHEDLLIPSSCLNCTVSGLVSRTFLRDDIIGKEDFHGAVYYGELKDKDLSYEFIDTIEKEFEIGSSKSQQVLQEATSDEKGNHGITSDEKGNQDVTQRVGTGEIRKNLDGTGLEEVKELAAEYGISDINLIKPGIGETTRVLLRRVPWKILIDEKYQDDPCLAHLLRLAKEKEVPIEMHPLIHYKTCGIIKKLADA